MDTRGRLVCISQWNNTSDSRRRKVGHVLFNPAAENVLASSSGDYTVKLWDLEDGKSKLQLKHGDTVQSLSWSANGDMLVTTCRDKKLRFWDVRQQSPAHEVAGHAGAKNSRCVWLGEHDRVATTGFSKMSERQLGLWDLRNPTKPVGGEFMFLDQSSGVGMPFWDDGCQILYIAGKGDGNIRYYEYENDKFEALSEHKSPEPQRGLAFMPKRGVNTHDNEVMRAFKTVNDAYVEPISFIVPRRSETFQDDIYPPTVGGKPAVSSVEWFDGKSGLPPKFSMEDMYEGLDPHEVERAPQPTATSSAPVPVPAPAPTTREPPKEAPKPEPTPAPSATAREMPSVSSNKASMAAMAAKFSDDKAGDDDDASSDVSSSFEQVQKPIERPTASSAARQPEPGAGLGGPPSASHGDTAASQRAPASTGDAPDPPADKAGSPPASDPAPRPDGASASLGASAPSATSAAAGGLREVLQEIRGLLQSQGQQLETMNAELAALKERVG